MMMNSDVESKNKLMRSKSIIVLMLYTICCIESIVLLVFDYTQKNILSG